MWKMIKYVGLITYCWILIVANRINGELLERYVGCFVENGGNQKAVTVLEKQTNLTIEICIEKCYSETNQTKTEMTFAALTNGKRCACRNNPGQQLPDQNCNVKCSGNTVQKCGGNSNDTFYSLYTVCPVGYFGPICDQLCNCKRHLPCDRKAGICPDGCDDQWNGTNCNNISDIQKQYIGCYGDGPRIGGKQSKHAMDVKNPGGKTGSGNRVKTANSNEVCIDVCSSYSYTYAGMQYGYDCNCGEKYDRYGNKTHDNITVDCNDPSLSCPANPNQKCGGGYANSVYYVCPIGFYGRPCVNRCQCNGNPCRFNGSCLNAAHRSCQPGWTGSACNIRDCKINNGDCQSDENCEAVDLGFANVSVCRCKDGSYRDNNTCRPKLASLRYVGCCTGSTTQYTAVDLPTGGILATEFCIEKCAQLNKAYSIITGGEICMCGDNYGQVTIDSDCRFPCTGNHLQYCGGKNTTDGMSIYAVYAANSFSRQYIGCYNDTRDQAIKNKFSWSSGANNTIESCTRHCDSHDNTYAGLQYGYDCFCGNSYDKYGPLAETRCNIYCSGNKNQTCGGTYANSVYAVSDILRCSNDADCNSNEGCNLIDLNYMNVSRCRCKKGFSRMMTWEHCEDVDECQSGTSTCDPISQNCHNTIGSFRCECKDGFLENKSGICEDIDECMTTSHTCDNETELCNNTPGNYTCQCKPGYENSTSGNCTDVNECQLGRPTPSCDTVSENCFNSVGSYNCTCKDGFTNTSGKCEDVNECQPISPCDIVSENCLNNLGSYNCICKDKFTNASGKCEAIPDARSGAQTGAIVVSLLVVVIAIVIVALLWVKRKTIFTRNENGASKPMSVLSNHKEDRTTDKSQEMSIYDEVNHQTSYKIPVSELPAEFRSKKLHSGALEKEFKSVPVDDSTKTCREGKKKELKHRNRFQNIIPYDQNRVILHQQRDKFSDYINASFIKSYYPEEKLIASQGPNDDTLTHFWQMIYENNVGTIVMITNLFENAKKKCARYWPESDGHLTLDDITITLKLTESWPNYVIRHLQLTKGSSTMGIKQWHFTVWPDHGVPSDIKGFLNFRRSVRQSMFYDKYTIVHCSAGVGRTGTFIAINYLLEQAEAEGLVDIVGCLSFLRQQRTQMVQTLDQYEFIYAALASEFTIGNTTISADNFNSEYQNLLIRDKVSGKTHLEMHFQALQDQWAQQVESENPFHVFAKSLDMCEISEASQAVFVQSWKSKDAYIVTEYPEKATVNYFWTICLDYECKFVIHLDNGQNSSLFFPTQPAEWLYVDSWSLQCKSSDKEHYGTRLKVVFSQYSESAYANTTESEAGGEVTLFKVKAYVNDTRLNYDAIHAAYSAMKSLESKSGAKKSTIPVVIVSRPNCALCGLFIAAFNAFEMLDEAKEVDLYQVVYDIKKSRSKLIPSLATYEELHNIVNHRIEYTSAASVYSNA